MISSVPANASERPATACHSRSCQTKRRAWAGHLMTSQSTDRTGSGTNQARRRTEPRLFLPIRRTSRSEHSRYWPLHGTSLYWPSQVFPGDNPNRFPTIASRETGPNISRRCGFLPSRETRQIASCRCVSGDMSGHQRIVTGRGTRQATALFRTLRCNPVDESERGCRDAGNQT